MPIYISNDLYLSAIESSGVRNRPLIGWHSVFNVGSVTDTEGNPGFGQGPSAVWSPDTYTSWVSNTTGPGESITATLEFENDDDGGEVNYVGIFGHSFNSNSINYRIQYSNNGADWTNATEYRIPANNYPIIDYFDDVTAGFWRIQMVVPQLSGTEVTHVKVGRILQLERPRYVGDIPGGMDLRVEKIGSRSYSGQHLGSVVVSEGDAFNVTQENNTPEFIRGNDLQYFFRHAWLLEKMANGPVESFFYAWRPDDYPNEVQYCGQTTSYNPPTNQSPNGDMQWSMQGDAFKRRRF